MKKLIFVASATLAIVSCTKTTSDTPCPTELTQLIDTAVEIKLSTVIDKDKVDQMIKDLNASQEATKPCLYTKTLPASVAGQENTTVTINYNESYIQELSALALVEPSVPSTSEENVEATEVSETTEPTTTEPTSEEAKTTEVSEATETQEAKTTEVLETTEATEATEEATKATEEATKATDDESEAAKAAKAAKETDPETEASNKKYENSILLAGSETVSAGETEIVAPKEEVPATTTEEEAPATTTEEEVPASDL